MTTVQKIIKYLALAFAIFLCVSILSGICGALYYVSGFFGGHTSDELSEHVIDSDFTNLTVDISAAELEIKTGDAFGIETNHRYLTYKENGDTLEIRETKPFFASHHGMKVIVTVPKGTVFNSAAIHAGAGSVRIDELSAGSLNIQLGAGEFEAGHLDALHQAEIDGGAGSVTIRGGYLNNADIDMGVGEFNLTGELDGNSSMDYGVGETNLALAGTADDYRIELDKGIGEAWLDGKKMTDGSVYGSGSRRLEIDGGIGELHITFIPKPEQNRI